MTAHSVWERSAFVDERILKSHHYTVRYRSPCGNYSIWTRSTWTEVKPSVVPKNTVARVAVLNGGWDLKGPRFHGSDVEEAVSKARQAIEARGGWSLVGDLVGDPVGSLMLSPETSPESTPESSS